MVTNEFERNEYSIGIGVDYLWTLATNGNVSMFGGPGLGFIYGNRKDARR